jgi:hypothetical protein
MIKTVGVCGYGSTGSSAVVDLLHEFDETQIFIHEFIIAHRQNGLEDLEYFLKKYRNLKAVKQFIKFVMNYQFLTPYGKKRIINISEISVSKELDDFLNRILSNSHGYNYKSCIDAYFSKSNYIKRIIRKMLRMCRINTNIYSKFNLDVVRNDFDDAAKLFVLDILNVFGINYNLDEKEIVVLNQPFQSYDPVKSFKFFENPRAVIVSRDPRDHYLFNKYFLSQRVPFSVAPTNVDDYIRHFRYNCIPSQNLRERKDIMFLNFEELVYDCDNTTKKIADFLGIKKQIHKGEYFKPTHSRNNTQLSKKYAGCEDDIKKIEKELSEYIFPFENYPDIEPEGGMFYNCQIFKETGKML